MHCPRGTDAQRGRTRRVRPEKKTSIVSQTDMRALVLTLARIAAAAAGTVTIEQDLVAIDTQRGCTIDVYLSAPSAIQTYALYGSDHPEDMYIPAAYQYPDPYGRSVGGPDPYLVSFTPDLDKDSFLTIGDVHSGMLASVGIDFNSWSASTPLHTADGAVFVLDPDRSPRGRVRLARVTIPSSAPMRFSIQGQHYDKTPEHSDRLDASYAIELRCEQGH